MPSQTTRRSFLTSGIALATTLQLQRAGHALGLPASANVCQLTAEQEVGPYYVSRELLRDAIAEDQPGIPLTLHLMLLNARTCEPLPNAAIDLWHCDALGLYSGFTKQNPRGPGGPGRGGPSRGGPNDGPDGRPPGPPPDFDPQHPGNHPGPPEGMGPPPENHPPENHPTDKLTFCRGIQISDTAGAATFHTIFPGFYMGRANHIYFKVRLDSHPERQMYAEGHTAHIGQVFFPEAVTARLMQNEPYSRHTIHRTTQTEDNVFTDQHGSLSIASLRAVQHDNAAAGFAADLVASVDPTATPAPAQRGSGPPPRR